MIFTYGQAVITSNTTTVINFLCFDFDAFRLADTSAMTAFRAIILIEDNLEDGKF